MLTYCEIYIFVQLVEAVTSFTEKEDTKIPFIILHYTAYT